MSEELKQLESILDAVCGVGGGIPVDEPIYTISLTEIAEAFRRLKAGQGEAVKVVAYLPTEQDLGIKYNSKAGPVTWFGDPPRGEHLMTVAQHESIDSALTRHMNDHAPMRIPVDMTDSDIVQEELRALLAQSQEVKS